ncbi:hypothetical protein [Chitinophaga niabensis]|uniref:Uncharacterized protein n=1 Tax=Chitinophaga niabensis TaxID=536979 RepID=A0A1N6F4Q8_9BACT|nr:hypothetical protein [Chitinophaga niabensis]SIN90237.1 hypothetical protein SAMN04488055_2014 [Chitinophaga niabensis]
MLQSKEIENGEYHDLYSFLMKDLQLFKRKFIFSLKHVETGESQKCFFRYFERPYQQELIRLFNENDFKGILALPTGEEGKCATQLEGRYVKSGKLVGLQVIEARPHEGGRYVGLTPAKVFLDAEGEKIVGDVAKLHK